MNIELTIKNQILKRTDSNIIVSKSKHEYNCLITFEETEDNPWGNQNKFIIFTDSWGNSKTYHLGNTLEPLSCPLPDFVLEGTYFMINVYAGDLITTNNVVIVLEYSDYSYQEPCSYTDTKDILVEIFNSLDTKIDNISYSDNCLELYSQNNLLVSVYLPFINKIEFHEWMEEYSDKFEYLSLNKSDVDHVHEYSDLRNIPEKFPVEDHQHVSSDITDFEDTTSVEIRRGYQTLIQKIRTYGG